MHDYQLQFSYSLRPLNKALCGFDKHYTGHKYKIIQTFFQCNE
jgi:hypothetical protein